MEEEILKLNKELKLLKKQIDDINKYIEEKKKQQISFPLDEVSKNIINNI